MRLTIELIEKVPQFVNPLKERELDLRGNKIAQIENLGTTEDGFDTIDFSDNEISKLENFPLSRRLTCIIAHNNRLSRIAPGLGKSLPCLNTLALHNNHFKELSELDPLVGLPRLQRLSLIDNAVTKLADYRLYIIARCPALKWLDFKKVKPAERKKAIEKFGEAKEGNTFEPGEALPGASVGAEGKPTVKATLMADEEQDRIRKLIESATSLEEVKKLEQQLLQTMEGDE
eukprot:TRINITY_DN67028_c2_g1_i1.p1 TRINITY_DN67028_c2_g1~~TRINITY_DN67028_c2_g1_i1.p1  ORF type:complete len:231 (-),score=29.21 TRINITY_DN67028_c2_g1_i1:827-1519(-)